MKSKNALVHRLCFGFAVTIALLASTGSARSETEETLDKTFTVVAGGRLVTDVDFGSIEVGSHSGNDVTIHVWRNVSRRNKADEEKFLREQPVTFSQEGNTVTIRSHRESGTGWSWRGPQRTEGKYTITVPAKFNVQLKTSGGGIEVHDLAGEVNAHTSGGGLKFDHLNGSVDGRTSGGGIRVGDCQGEIKIETSGGGIHVTGGKGVLDGKTSGGSVEVSEFRGPARVHSSGGGITIENVVGKVDGSTSGGSISASFSSPLSDDVRLETSAGGVTMRVAATSAFDLDASTSGGGVDSELPVTVVGKTGRNFLKGPVNGGGRSVLLRTSGGSIHVKKL
ncbi:MAG: DUF4097 family beta strand repeat protein [Verrucomicrobia bacterium]|nr:DUF4097 family beta strand repeat protein [Verrucomicrobiota bacterium]